MLLSSLFSLVTDHPPEVSFTPLLTECSEQRETASDRSIVRTLCVWLSLVLHSSQSREEKTLRQLSSASDTKVHLKSHSKHPKPCLKLFPTDYGLRKEIPRHIKHSPGKNVTFHAATHFALFTRISVSSRTAFSARLSFSCVSFIIVSSTLIPFLALFPLLSMTWHHITSHLLLRSSLISSRLVVVWRRKDPDEWIRSSVSFLILSFFSLS